MNFAALKGLTIPQGAVKQIADSSGRILWSASKPIVLTVEKVTATTYAGETTYNDEQFILLDIYPKTNGTVKVTYGGLTKTITDTSGVESPNAQGVYFGTFNGVSDSVATPSSGTLTIDGDYRGFSTRSFSTSSKGAATYCGCITTVDDFGDLRDLNNVYFKDCTNFNISSLPNNITSIGASTFYGCSGLTLSSLPSSITRIGANAFYKCGNLTLSSIPGSVKTIEENAFYGCKSLQFNDNFFNKGLETIGNQAFYYANKGAQDVFTYYITIPETVTNIGAQAFTGYSEKEAGVSYFYRIRVLPKTPPIAENTGSDTQDGIFGRFVISFVDGIIVPKGCGDAYKTAQGWKDYADLIREEA